jgi:hypothetical protein
MYCWKCFEKQDIENKKVSFRATCETCGFDLHVCKNCKFYFPGKPNDCLAPQTEPVADREKFNFCEEFRPKDEKPTNSYSNKSDIEKKLFNDSDDDDTKTDFDSLFKD